MGYHDRDTFEKRWNTNKKPGYDKNSNPPAVQIISPQKKLFDIQQLLNTVPEKAMTVAELHGAIQKILDGEV